MLNWLNDHLFLFTESGCETSSWLAGLGTQRAIVLGIIITIIINIIIIIIIIIIKSAFYVAVSYRNACRSIVHYWNL